MKIFAAALLIFLFAGAGAGAVIMSGRARGIRNNNPGNIRKGPRWQGLAADQSTDPDFAVFTSPEWGLRAIARTLRTYRERYGINTIRGAISRWAPSTENNTEAYISAVAAHVGASADAPLDFTKKAVLIPLMEAITRHENGRQPYPLALMHRAAELAGVMV